MSKTSPHYHGHRQRLRERFLNGTESALADYELLELLLFGANPRGDVKPTAKELINTFGSITNVIYAQPKDLRKIKGMGDAAVAILKAIQQVSIRSLRSQAMERPVLSSWDAVLNYCAAQMEHLTIEQLRLIFLDRKNQIICDEVQQTGTIDYTPIFPREVVKRSLDIGAAAFIMVHNHPSGDPTPSPADIDMTRKIRDVSERLGIHLHDHIIIGNGCYTSFKSEGLI
ncbi:MAG: RadC family protein [Alphaproteobacteria bacterium]